MSGNGLLHELPVLPATKTDDDRCSECAHCCTYIAVPIERPSDRDTVSSILWYLYHGQVRVYLDHEHDWYVQFWTRCEALRPDGLCGVYETRPDVCEEFTATDCEVTTEDYGEVVGFDTAVEFVEWVKENQPKLYARAKGGRKRNLTRAPEKQKATENVSLLAAANGEGKRSKRKKKKGFRTR